MGGRGVDSKMARVASQQLEEDISAQSHDSESWSDSELETKGAARGRAKERGQESAEEYDEDAEIDGLDDDGDATTTDGETEERARTLRRRPRTTRGEKNPGAAAPAAVAPSKRKAAGGRGAGNGRGPAKKVPKGTAAAAAAEPVTYARATLSVAQKAYGKGITPVPPSVVQGPLALDGEVKESDLKLDAWPYASFEELYSKCCAVAKDVVKGCDTTNAQLLWCGRTRDCGKPKCGDGDRNLLNTLDDLFRAMEASGRVRKENAAKPRRDRRDQNGVHLVLQLQPHTNTPKAIGDRLVAAGRGGSPRASPRVASQAKSSRSRAAAAAAEEELAVRYFVQPTLRGPLLLDDGTVATVIFDTKVCKAAIKTFGSERMLLLFKNTCTPWLWTNVNETAAAAATACTMALTAAAATTASFSFSCCVSQG